MHGLFGMQFCPPSRALILIDTLFQYFFGIMSDERAKLVAISHLVVGLGNLVRDLLVFVSKTATLYIGKTIRGIALGSTPSISVCSSNKA